MRRFVKKVSYSDPVLGRTCYRLIALDGGEEIAPYYMYLRRKVQAGSPKNTVTAIANDLADFFDFLHSVSYALVNQHDLGNATVLSETIFAYPQYLIFGPDSANKIARIAAETLGSSSVSRSTAERRISTLRGFIRASEVEHETQMWMKEKEIIDADVSPEEFFNSLKSKRRMSEREKSVMASNSMMSAVVKKGERYINSPIFSLPKAMKSKKTRRGDFAKKAFPANRIIDLLDKAPSYRDRVLWSLLAGTGIRTHEALQLQLSHIDAEKETVLIKNYHDRSGSFRGIDSGEIEKLSFKGRALEEAIFMQPMQTIFFDSLAQYIERERGHSIHDFLFVSLSNNSRGKPLFTADATSHNYSFKKTQEKIGMEKPFYTLHSLRHFYGTWMRNYMPNGDRFGFDTATVQYLMGHESIATTEGYAVLDDELVKAKMQRANQLIASGEFSLGEAQKSIIKTINSLKGGEI